MEPVRLNKYLSERGVCSRREADRLIGEGAVTVNGARAGMGMRVTNADEIRVNGALICEKVPKKVIIAVNKPVGVVCTTRAFHGEENIVDLVQYGERLYPVGRLDKDSEGLIFLTNDGAFARESTRAAGRHEKEYEVTVHKDLTPHFLKRMEAGVYLKELEKQTAACKVTRVNARTFRIVLTQGLNRQIRRMCAALGYDVASLRRVRIMNVTLGDLPAGQWREITGEELEALNVFTYKKKNGGGGKAAAEKKPGGKKPEAGRKTGGRKPEVEKKTGKKPAAAKKNLGRSPEKPTEKRSETAHRFDGKSFR